MSKIPKVVRVDWIDSSRTAGWDSMERASRSPDLRCSTVGYLIHQDEKIIKVSASVAHEGDKVDSFCDAITIPRVAVKRIRRVPMGKL